MAKSKYKYTQETYRFKRRMKGEMTSSGDENENFDFSIIPKESDLKKVSQYIIKIQKIQNEFKNIEKSLKINSNDKITIAEYLKASKNGNLLSKIEKLIMDLNKNYFDAKSLCLRGENKRSMIFGLLFYTIEKVVKKICDLVFGKGNPSSLRLLVLLKDDLKERKTKVLGRREYVESSMNMGVHTELDDDSINYNEGGNF